MILYPFILTFIFCTLHFAFVTLRVGACVPMESGMPLSDNRALSRPVRSRYHHCSKTARAKRKCWERRAPVPFDHCARWRVSAMARRGCCCGNPYRPL